MKMNKLIQRYEYSSLKIGDDGFNEDHWRAMGQYEQKHGRGFFTLYPDRVKFAQYVGVIQVNELTIEILPKVDGEVLVGQKYKWQQFLLDMLQQCHWMQSWSHQKAYLRFKYNNILEAYLGIFLNECWQLLRTGLIKKYRKQAKNVTALKGQLLFHQQIQRNLVHQERFYTTHSVYDKNNVYNQILATAIQLVPQLTSNPSLKESANQLLFEFPDLEPIAINQTLFERLTFDRKSEAYREPISIASMLLLNYRPDISSGNNHILSLLFDMNELWEEFIYRQLLRFSGEEWQVGYQQQRKFWTSSMLNVTKIIMPDIVLHHIETGKKVIIDTKWKIPENEIPNDADLKPIFVYNEYWQSNLGILLYPSVDSGKEIFYINGNFVGTSKRPAKHTCGVVRVSVLDKRCERLNNDLGYYLLKQLNALQLENES